MRKSQGAPFLSGKQRQQQHTHKKTTNLFRADVVGVEEGAVDAAAAATAAWGGGVGAVAVPGAAPAGQMLASPGVTTRSRRMCRESSDTG